MLHVCMETLLLFVHSFVGIDLHLIVCSLIYLFSNRSFLVAMFKFVDQPSQLCVVLALLVAENIPESR